MDVCRFVQRQRDERRYAPAVLGAMRFWWDAARDAVLSGVRLRLEGLGRGLRRWTGRGGGATAGRPGNGPSRMGRGREGRMPHGFLRDVYYAIRSLRKSPGYTTVFVLTLGLGIGANSAIFSAVNGVLVQPLPHENGQELVYLRHSAERPGMENVLFSVPEIEDYRQGATSLRSVAEFSALTFTMLGLDEPRRVRAGIVTGNYFDVIGLRAVLGRTIRESDDGEAADPVTVLTHEFWQQVFGGDPGVLGKTMRMNGRTVTVVGVLEPAPPYPERTDLFVNMVTSPHHLSASMNHERDHRMTEVFARLAPGATLENVRAEVRDITARIHRAYPDEYDPGSGFQVSATLLKDQLTRRARSTLLILLGTAVFVLVIACANLANLTLSRFLSRDHEFAVRASLGGSRTALRRQLLAESLLLSVAGALLGLGVAYASLDLIVSYAARFTSRATEIGLDGLVYGFALVVAAGASLFFAWIPDLPGGSGIGARLVSSGSRSTGGSRDKRLQRGLVVVQVAVSFVLLIGAGLLMRTLLNLQRVDPGFDTEQVLTMDIPWDFGVRTEEEERVFYTSVLEEVRNVPGVSAAALSNSLPLSGGFASFTNQMQIAVDGFEPPPGSPKLRASFRVVTPEYFRAMGIPVLQGRAFLDTDEADAQPVVVINRSMAEDYFGDQEAIGKRIAWTDPNMRWLGVDRSWRTVVGVVGDTRDEGFDQGVVHAVYNPYAQVTWAPSLVVRTAGDPAAVIQPITRIVRARDPDQPIANVATLAQKGAEAVAPRRLNAVLLGAFALLALVIAAVGIGGVLAFSVGRRTREFGIRGALGASRRQVRSGVLSEGAVLTGLGVAVGVFGALALTRFISGLLFGVPPTDPVTYLAVGTILATVAMAASWLPAWRASRVDPLEALRAE